MHIAANAQKIPVHPALAKWALQKKSVIQRHHAPAKRAAPAPKQNALVQKNVAATKMER